MYIFGKTSKFAIITGKLVLAVLMLASVMGMATGAQAQGATVLPAADAGKILPASVWFKGQSATTQPRNSGGVKFADGFFVLSTLVDTSGYSSDVSSRYQAYFITEVPLRIEGHELAAGVYGIGFIPGDKFVVLDVGAHDLFVVSSHTDVELKRPVPLKVSAEKDSFRLWEGRKYITFAR
jgi:hypothetical protein